MKSHSSVAVCCSVLQCVAVGCRAAFEEKEVLKSSNIALSKNNRIAAEWFRCTTEPFAVNCCVLRCVAVCCSVLQCVAVCCNGKSSDALEYRSSESRGIAAQR